MKIKLLIAAFLLACTGLHAMEPIASDNHSYESSSDESSFDGLDYFTAKKIDPSFIEQKTRKHLLENNSNQESKRQKRALTQLALTSDELELIKENHTEKHPLEYPLDLLLEHAVETNNAARIKLLLQHDADPNIMVEDDHGIKVPLLTVALIKNKLEIADILLHYGANINQLDDAGETALLTLCQTEEAEAMLPAIRWLIAHGIHLDHKNDDDINALSASYRHKNFPTFKFLCKSGAYLDCYENDRANKPLLHRMCTKNQKYMHHALCLLANKANANIREGQFSTTPLMVACLNNNIMMVQILLYYGADPLLEDNEGETAAQFTTNSDILTLLKSKSLPPLPEQAYAFLFDEARNGKNIAKIVANRSLGKRF